jgi:hypothetical protein
VENLTGLLFLGYVTSGIKLLWALTVPLIIYLICRKIKGITPQWIIYGLVFVAIVNLQNVVPVILSRMLSVTQYSQVFVYSGFLNAAGAIVFLISVYGMAAELKKRFHQR